MTAGPFRLGLTGSAAMGKSTTAGIFRALGVPVWDADRAVHALYAPGGAGTAAVGRLVPDAVTAAGVDRDRLRAAIAADSGLLGRLEAAIHPLLAEDRRRFLAVHATKPLVVLDIPLLFETGLADLCDAVLVVTAPEAVQRERLARRPGLTEAEIRAILARQMPDAEKRARADYVIETQHGLEAVRADVARLVARLRGGDDARDRA